MKKFAFKLQSVLDIKAKNLDEKLIDLSKVLKLITEEREKINVLKLNKNSIVSQLNEIYSNSQYLDIGKINGLKNYLPKLEEQINEINKKIMDMENVLEIKKFEVNQAFREKKILEKFKEKQRNKFYSDIEVSINKELDDITSARRSCFFKRV